MASELSASRFLRVNRGRALAWLRAGRGGLFLLALLTGAGSGLGAVAFRYLISLVTWLATGHGQFGQQGARPAVTCRGWARRSSSSSRPSAGWSTGR